jgi:cysteine-rich repeat protein
MSICMFGRALRGKIWLFFGGFLLNCISSCYEPLDTQTLCHPLSSECKGDDFDGDGVNNQVDEFPFDPNCAKNDVMNCGGCGIKCGMDSFCSIERVCEEIREEVCNGKDDDGNLMVDENVEMADLQDGVCFGSLKVCLMGVTVMDYELMDDYQEVEDRCDGLDNDCDGKIEENISNCCGNGILEGMEECDDGNLVDTDGCTLDCQTARCGDGIVREEVEQCDDGNLVDTDECHNDCTRCGDGVVQALAGEECDDGNSIHGDICGNDCKTKPCGAHCPAMEMILMQAGSFDMGSNTSTSAQPIHNVQIRSNFYVGKTEVTVGQYRACVNAGQCSAPDGFSNSSSCNWTSSVGSKETHPVNCVDWNQARTFAKWVGGDLLTEAQWEYVATAQGKSIIYPWGNTEPTCEIVNFYNCVGSTAPVCSTTGGNTAQGVCDMGGNVWEWVLDEWHASYSGAPANEQAWCSDIGVCNTNTLAHRVDRGGSWFINASYLRSAYRNYGSPGFRNNYLGFRVSDLVP